ncbi:MAG TPA: sialidase family protein [Tepidisphaeraceae bacterium]|jgi:hypothetical protein
MGSSPSRRAQLEPLESRTLLSASVSTTPTIVNASKLLVGPQENETIVYNPTSPNQLYLIADDAGAGLFTATSTDGGHTWTQKVQFTGSDGFPTAGFGSSTAYDSFGDLYVAYKRADTGSTEVLFSYDNGQTFHVLSSLSGIQDDPILATGPGPKAGQAAVWLAVKQSMFTGNATNVQKAQAATYSAAVTGLGRIGKLKAQSFSDVAAMPEGLAVGPAGQVTVAYQYSTDIGPTVIYTRTDADGLGPQAFGPPTTSVMTTVGTNTLIPAMSASGISANATLAYDNSPDAYTGRLYMAYTSAPTASGDNTNIYLRYSDDDGATWSSPIQVNDDTSVNSHMMPVLSVDPVTGAVAIAWYDSRNDNGIPTTGGTNNTANDDIQVYGVVGTPVANGVNFSPNFIIQPAFSNSAKSTVPSTLLPDTQAFGLHNGLTIYNGRANAAWADNSNSTGDNGNGALISPDVYVGTYTVTTTNPPNGTFVGAFGTGAGTLKFTESDGTIVTFQLNRGHGYLFTDSSGNLELRLSATTTSSALSITARNGSRRVSLSNVSVLGSLSSINATSADITGTFAVSGSVKQANVGTVSGGTFSAGGTIGNLTVASLTNANVLSGAQPGPDNVFSGAGDTDDVFASGAINSLVVRGAITNSVVGAGVNPVDGVFGNGNDTIIGGAASRIGTLRAATADSASHFEAGAFGNVLLPQKIDPATDSRFLIG